MSNKIIIVDFDDSFTYNIASTLYEREQSIQVIHHKDFFEHLNSIVTSKDKRAIIFGPGPGHPAEYQLYFPQIKLLMEQKNIFIMGICLGHQIMGQILGHQIKKVNNQLHGVAIDYLFNGLVLKVQRYNSLGVFEGEKELMSLDWENGVSYQFHPESIGTENNLLFFQNLLHFLK